MNNRRGFLLAVGALVLHSGCSQNGSTTNPIGPSPISSAPPSNSQYPLQAWWGERIGEIRTAGVAGTLPEVMTAARLNPMLNNSGLLVSFDGATAPRGIVLLVDGQYFNRAINNIRLSPGQTWAAYHWSGQATQNS